MSDVVSKKQQDQKSDMERLHDWMEAVGGSLFPGESKLESIKSSKSGNKLTIVLKRKKHKKDSAAA